MSKLTRWVPAAIMFSLAIFNGFMADFWFTRGITVNALTSSTLAVINLTLAVVFAVTGYKDYKCEKLAERKLALSQHLEDLHDALQIIDIEKRNK